MRYDGGIIINNMGMFNTSGNVARARSFEGKKLLLELVHVGDILALPFRNRELILSYAYISPMGL